MGGTDCFTRLGGSDAEPEEGDEHGGHNVPGAWGDGCVCVCTSGWICAVWSLTAPLLCVFIKVSCDKMKVINIFADHKVRKSPNHVALMGAGRVLGARGEHRGVGGRWGAGILPVLVWCSGGAGALCEPPAQMLGCPAGSHHSQGPAQLPSPSHTHLHLQPKQHWWLLATLGTGRARRKGRDGHLCLGSRQRFQLFRERNTSLCLGELSPAQTPTHTYCTAS